ncbi:MAG: GrlR family regulatory protein [Bradyrhizobium sp.]
MMFKGLYKVEFKTPRRKAVGIVYAADGKLRGGSSAYAYVGSYTENGDTITAVISSMRHTNDPNYPSVFGFDRVTIDCQGSAKGEFATFEGTAAETPSLGFKAFLTRIAD